MTVKEYTKEQNLAAIKAKAIHREKVKEGVDESHPDKNFHVTQKEHIVTVNNKPLKDSDGNLIKTHPFVRTKISGDQQPVNQDNAPDPDKTDDSNKGKSEGDNKGSGLDASLQEKAKQLASMPIPDMKAIFEEIEPSLELLKAIKEYEKKNRKSPQCYTLINKYVKAIQEKDEK